MDMQVLFSGGPLPRGGLSNEEELAKLCPKEFFDSGNPWTTYIGDASLWGRKEDTWKWRSNDSQVREQQLACLDNVLDGHQLKMSTKNAIAGWMLSQMLVEVPPGR